MITTCFKVQPSTLVNSGTQRLIICLPLLMCSPLESFIVHFDGLEVLTQVNIYKYKFLITSAMLLVLEKITDLFKKNDLKTFQ